MTASATAVNLLRYQRPAEKANTTSGAPSSVRPPAAAPTAHHRHITRRRPHRTSSQPSAAVAVARAGPRRAGPEKREPTGGGFLGRATACALTYSLPPAGLCGDERPSLLFSSSPHGTPRALPRLRAVWWGRNHAWPAPRPRRRACPGSDGRRRRVPVCSPSGRLCLWAVTSSIGNGHAQTRDHHSAAQAASRHGRSNQARPCIERIMRGRWRGHRASPVTPPIFVCACDFASGRPNLSVRSVLFCSSFSRRAID